MRTLRVRDVMTTRVVAVTPSTPFREVVELMLHRRVGAVPVLDDHGALVGLISEADLITKQAYGDRRRHVLTGVPGVAQQEARGMTRSLGQTARELMSAPVETALPDDTLRALARRMVEHRLRHLVVVDETRAVVGIVSRRDLLRAFERSDAEIEHEVRVDLSRCRHAEGGEITVVVDQGVVTLDGRIRDPADIPAVSRVAWLVPGVVDVVSHLVGAPDPATAATTRPAPDEG
jgi:CBS domain-containing protein